LQAIGPGVAGYAYVGESGSSRLRAKTTTLGVLGNAIVGLIINVALPWMLNAPSAGGRGWGVKTGMSDFTHVQVLTCAAWMFFILGFACCVIIYLFIPEYSGRTYAQIDEMFLRKVPARRFKTFQCSGDYGRDLNLQPQRA
jgi:SP family general alpha glucoside:H+ symporter-like MFS transporter